MMRRPNRSGVRATPPRGRGRIHIGDALLGDPPVDVRRDLHVVEWRSDVPPRGLWLRPPYERAACWDPASKEFGISTLARKVLAVAALG